MCGYLIYHRFEQAIDRHKIRRNHTQLGKSFHHKYIGRAWVLAYQQEIETYLGIRYRHQKAVHLLIFVS